MDRLVKFGFLFAFALPVWADTPPALTEVPGPLGLTFTVSSGLTLSPDPADPMRFLVGLPGGKTAHALVAEGSSSQGVEEVVLGQLRRLIRTRFSVDKPEVRIRLMQWKFEIDNYQLIFSLEGGATYYTFLYDARPKGHPCLVYFWIDQDQYPLTAQIGPLSNMIRYIKIKS